MQVEGREKYVYVVAPHIGILEDGKIGGVHRFGREKVSSACGALCAVQGMLQKGPMNTDLDLDDVEMSLVKQLVQAELPEGHKPDLVELTKISADIIRRQLEKAITATVKTDKADYAVVCGIQIHGPGIGKQYFMPLHDHCYAVVKGDRHQLNLGA